MMNLLLIILDVEIMEEYIVKNLGGVIDESYAEADCRITFTEGEVTHPQGEYAIWIAGVSGVLVVAAVAAILAVRKKKLI